MPASSSSPSLALTTPIAEVPGVGPRRAEAFRRLGILSVAHLVHYLPSRHEFEAGETTIDGLAADRVGAARGEVTDTRVVQRRRPPRFEAALTDHTGTIHIVWFNQTFLHRRIRPGMRLLVKGKPRRHDQSLQLVNPHWERLNDSAEEPPARAERLRPIYPASEELPSTAIESAIDAVLDQALPLIEDHLPEDFRAARDLPSLAEAYRMMHRPGDWDEIAGARRRLAYDELFMLQLGVHMKRAHDRRAWRAPALRWSQAIDEHIRARFPFDLTTGQNEAVREIVADLTKDAPANRLIQGDVGSGKTVVALYAMLLAAASRKQAALMAPTEILAEQHFASISRLLQGANVRMRLLTGALSENERRDALASVEAGEVDLVVGTHALLTRDVRFNDLAVIVIDEQHRFGVRQRAALREKTDDPNSTPHALVMTATPIPRTLSLTIFGDLDISTIRDQSPGRTPIETNIVPPRRSDEVYHEVRRRLDAGEQAFFVVPAIESDGDLQDVHRTLDRLENGPLRGKRLAAIHGRLKRATRERIMEQFRAGRIDALVATTVIEVGVDVPGASIMVIEHADRFGLAQLHQLRGRIGRTSPPSPSGRGDGGEGDRASISSPSPHAQPGGYASRRAALCALIAEPATEDARARLEAFAAARDGFDLAEKDLHIRGPGEAVGARQSGLPPFRVADLARGTDLLLLARRDAAEWIARSPDLSRQHETLLRSRLLKSHGESLGLADVA